MSRTESTTHYRHDDGREASIEVHSHAAFGDVYFGYRARLPGGTERTNRYGLTPVDGGHDRALADGIRETRRYLDRAVPPGALTET